MGLRDQTEKKKSDFVSKIIPTCMRKNCSSDREKLLKFKLEGQEFTNILQSTRTIYSNKVSYNFLEQNVFLTSSWRFCRLEQFEQL